MAKLGTLTLTGASGQTYKFNVYAIGAEFNQAAAVYYFSVRGADDAEGTHSHQPVYIGQTGDISERFDDHHKAECIRRNGANCISIHQDGNEQSRLAKESDLVLRYSPPCNG